MAKLSTTSVFGDLLVDGMIHGNVTGNLTGNASTATSATTASKADILTTARNIALGGILTGSASFNGSANITINASVAKPPKSGDWFSGGIPTVNTDGVMEVGKYIDFHNTDASTNDYDVRLQANTSTPCVITLPTAAGTLARTNDNVASATKLQTPRTINGTNFDGSANITTANWGTARTLTIGNKGQSVNGSGNITWSTGDILGNATSLGKDSDWNTANATGIYEASGFNETGATGANRPVGAYSWGGVLTLRHKNVTNQIYLSHGSNQMWIRGGWNGSFNTSWARVYTTEHKPTYSDVGAAAASHGTHVTWSTTTPKANGTAAVGSETKVARGDHVHPLQTTVSGNAGTATKLETARTLTIGNTGKSFNGSANVSWSLSEIGAAAIADGVQTWNAVVKCATWSRILKHTGTTTVGGSYLINLKATRGNVVYNPTFIVNFSHSSKCFITQINNTDYSNIQVRAVVDSGNGSGYFEVYDNANSATNATSQTVNVTVLRLSRDTAFEKYTAFTDGTTIPSGYTEKSKFTTVSGSYYSGKAATAANAEVLQTARNIQIGNKTNSFNGSGNISYTLADIGALPTAGGTMTGNIKFSDVTSTTYPAKSAMLTWNGSTDGADIYYQVDASDKGRLVLNTRDDADCIIAFANKGTIVSTIDNSGNFSGKASKAGNADTATKLATARNIKIGNATKSFNGTANIEFTLADIGIGSSISAVASNLSGVTINGYDSMMTTINSNLGNL